MRLTESYGTLTPSTSFEFKISFLMRKVESVQPADGTDMGDPAGQRRAHAMLGAQLDAIIKKETTAARRVDLNTIIDGLRTSGACVEAAQDPEHGVKHCSLSRGHGGEHMRRCLACWRAVILTS
jgi:hypothetical protein